MSQKEIVDALSALTQEVRAGFERVYDRIEGLERVAGITYDELQELRVHFSEQINRTGKKIVQVEHVAQDLAKFVAREAAGKAQTGTDARAVGDG